ncbi:hypothetical protein HanXRQr2_Chr06g0244021 [Helianthus annuus]|uniref:Uncharacterized protein n=1 Tax=Helianthus annuus TaxID=4232 RepID=A0A9K3IQH1_HELAN|nr:hypothetical protein HanXRQr2_Chr06g0244021 [Helianthus annuus]
MLISWKLFYISSLLPHQFQSVLVCILGYKMGCSLLPVHEDVTVMTQ